MRVLLFTICVNLFNIGYCQDISISGQVISKSDSTYIEFAHIYIKNSTIGTYTNSQGQFIFHISDILINDTLIVSRIGYQQYSMPVTSLTNRDSQTIILQEDVLNLSEVIIHDQRDSVAIIIKNVLKNIRKNYPTKLHYLEGFYRELSLKGNTYTRLIEASLEITENSYLKDNTTTKIKVRQLRKSEDYREYSLKHQLYWIAMQKMAKLAWNLEYDNNLYQLLDINCTKKKWIRRFSNKWYFLERFEFEIIDIINNEGQTHYRIKFHNPPERSAAFTYYGGEMIVNMKDYAIVEWEYGMIAHPYKTFPAQNKGMFYKGRFYYKNHVIYSKIGEKYYPTYLERLSPSKGGTKMYVDANTKQKSRQYDKITFMVNRVITNKKEFDRIKKRGVLDNEVDLYDADFKYDSAFWNNYSILMLDPLLNSAKEDLEKEMTLKDQFKKNEK